MEKQRREVFFLLNETPKMVNSPRLLSSSVPYISPFVVDDNGDVWKKIETGYVHRLYNLFSSSHPNNISPDLRMKINIENAKRFSKGESYNYFKH
tara:strand:+ start:417 stop:701 length:285 start_codon:yes stop_codon:yes gene_type:complete